jgi:hypothetical protein
MTSESLTIEDIVRMKRFAASNGIQDGVVYISREAYIDLRVGSDPFGIYRQRRLMSQVLPEVMVYRGDEWWH